MDIEIISEQVMNKSWHEIMDMYVLIRESLRKWFSREVKGHGEKNPYRCDVVLETHEAFGISECMLPKIVGIYETNDGIIYFMYEDCDNPSEFDYVDTEDLIYIMLHLF